MISFAQVEKKNLESEPGDTPHSESVVTVVVVCTRADVATVYVQVVCVVSIVRRTRPPVAVASTIVEGAIADVPGIRTTVPSRKQKLLFLSKAVAQLHANLTRLRELPAQGSFTILGVGHRELLELDLNCFPWNP